MTVSRFLYGAKPTTRAIELINTCFLASNLLFVMSFTNDHIFHPHVRLRRTQAELGVPYVRAALSECVHEREYNKVKRRSLYEEASEESSFWPRAVLRSEAFKITRSGEYFGDYGLSLKARIKR